MLIVRGVNVFPSEVEAALLEIDGLAPHYLLRLQRPGLLDVLTIEVESDAANGDTDALVATTAHRLDRRLGVSCEVKVLPPGGVPRSEGKALRVIDERDL